MKRCAFLSMDSLEDFFAYDSMLFEPLKQRGWDAEEVSWRQDDHNWRQYDAIVIRTTWDYQQDPDAFIARLQEIVNTGVPMDNSLELVRWNLSKTYLKALQDAGVDIVPTLWRDGLTISDLSLAFEQFNTDELVVKPQVSANADDTFRVTKSALSGLQTMLLDVLAARPVMIQPFLRSITEQGEYSLFYFHDEFSHAICKQPAAGDFRVQEEHGGDMHRINASDAMLKLASETLAALPEKPLYSRIDMAYVGTSLALMEVELIEPSLYFNVAPDACERFVEHFVAVHGRGN